MGHVGRGASVPEQDYLLGKMIVTSSPLVHAPAWLLASQDGHRATKRRNCYSELSQLRHARRILPWWRNWS